MNRRGWRIHTEPATLGLRFERTERTHHQRTPPRAAKNHQSPAMTKGCYTCRRRRIVCDNGLPTCRKCRDAGKECLGYQKPLVWVKGGVASRGKMMGLSFDDVMDRNAPNRGTKKRPSEGDSSGPEQQSERQLEKRPEKQPEKQQVQRPEPSESSSEGSNRNNNGNNDMFWTGEDDSWNDTSQPLSRNYNGDGTLMHVRSIPSGHYDPSPSRPLVDPLFQDISRLSRFYIAHCKWLLCRRCEYCFHVS